MGAVVLSVRLTGVPGRAVFAGWGGNPLAKS